MIYYMYDMLRGYNMLNIIVKIRYFVDENRLFRYYVKKYLY